MRGDSVTDRRLAATDAHRLASDVATPPEQLLSLVSAWQSGAWPDDRLIGLALAQNGALPTTGLEELAASADQKVRAAAARNPAVSTDALERLAQDEAPYVAAVARARLGDSERRDADPLPPRLAQQLPAYSAGTPTEPNQPSAWAVWRGFYGLMAFVVLVLVLAVVLGRCSAGLDVFDNSPSCGDVGRYNHDVQEAGGSEFNDDSMNDYVEAQKNLEAAEQDCYDKGETPDYSYP
jgi:hypothetical protein